MCACPTSTASRPPASSSSATRPSGSWPTPPTSTPTCRGRWPRPGPRTSSSRAPSTSNRSGPSPRRVDSHWGPPSLGSLALLAPSLGDPPNPPTLLRSGPAKPDPALRQLRHDNGGDRGPITLQDAVEGRHPPVVRARGERRADRVAQLPQAHALLD